MSISSSSVLSGGQSQVDYYVEQMMIYESQPKYELLDKKSSLNSKRKVLSNLDSKLSALQTKSERFIDPITDYFSYRIASSSDSEKFSVSADSGAPIGNHSISVNRLAASDTRVSKTFTNTNSDFTGISEDQTFSIEVAHPTDDDDSNRESISVTVSASTFSGTNDDVLKGIVDAINSAMSSAQGNETIDNDEVAHASVVEEVDGESRIILRSGQSGYTYRMDFTDSADTLLNTLELNSTSQAAGSSGGYITSVGTSASNSSLNNQLTVDGLTFYRDSNTIEDIFDNITIDLLDTFSTTENMTISTDVDSVKNEVQEFLTSYNEAISFLRENAQINTTTYKSGALSSDLTYRSIGNDLRSILQGSVDSVTNSNYSKLFNIGIEFDSEGKLSISDTSKFENAVKANSIYVSDIFNSDEGFANQINDYLDNYVKTGGTIDSSKSNLDEQILQLDSRLTLMDDMLAKKETQLRSEMTELQRMMVELTNQQQFFSNFTSMYGN